MKIRTLAVLGFTVALAAACDRTPPGDTDADTDTPMDSEMTGDTDGEDDDINLELEAIVIDEVSDEEDRDIDFIRRNDY